MTPEELREAVARALREAWRDQGEVRGETLEWPDVEDVDREDWLAQAAAALATVREALREPSEEMCAAGAAKLAPEVAEWTDALGDTLSECFIIWRAMFDKSALGGLGHE